MILFQQMMKVFNIFELLYTISIQESYSNQCKIELTILPCYDSCYRCQKKSSTNSESHNCFENNCKEDYYVDPTKIQIVSKEKKRKTIGILI